MRKLIITLGIIAISGVLMLLVLLSAFTIKDTRPEDCSVLSTHITRVTQGSSYDIVFYDDLQNHFYINRGLEQGLNLEALKKKVLNKTVTLHLANLPTGASSHIAQLSVGEEVLFTEFD
jgi:hypothetical protein